MWHNSIPDLSHVRSENSIHNTDSEQPIQDLLGVPEDAMEEEATPTIKPRFF